MEVRYVVQQRWIGWFGCLLLLLVGLTAAEAAPPAPNNAKPGRRAVGKTHSQGQPLTITQPLHRIWQGLAWRRVMPGVAMHWSMQVWRHHIRQISIQIQISALLRTTRPLTPGEIQRWQSQGIQFSRAQGNLLFVGNIYPIRLLRTEALRWLEQNPLVVQVDTNAHPFQRLHSPLHVTAKEVQATLAHQAVQGGKAITGKGVVIGLIDTGIDVFHPTFFRADGGYFSWIDVNQDQQLTLGVDGVDLNKNGTIDKDEVLQCLHARYYSPYHRLIDPDPGKQCRAGQDWLYVDTNGNQQRDFGPQHQFTEDDPTYGERLFVIDDVNRNGRLDVGEKVVALKTSKIQAVWYQDNVFERGRDLHRVPVVPQLFGSGHGTLSASVMVGGQRGFMQHLGLAPDSELLVGVSRGEDASGQPISTVDQAMVWLISRKVAIILHEYGQWLGQFLDGSSNHEQSMDAAAKQGIVQVTPVGNLGNTGKHLMVDVDAGSTATYPIEVNWPLQAPATNPPFRQLSLSLLWRGTPAPALQFTLVTPDNTQFALPKDNAQGQTVGSNLAVYSSQSTSSRGTHLMQATVIGFDVSSQQFTALPTGTWRLEVKGDPQQQTRLHAYLGDDQSNWLRGIHFTKNTSDQYTACWPSTADSSLGVAAYTGRSGSPYSHTPEPDGALRLYSSAGPRIDDARVVWLAAPDNPLAAVSPLEESVLPAIGYGNFLAFGGTSGASPHVAAAAALVKQLHPMWGPKEIKEALRQGALADDQVGTAPNPSWGYGKLRIYRSLYQKAPVPNQPPTITYRGPQQVWLGRLPKTLQVEVSDPESQAQDLRVQWDLDYDGTWETTHTTASIPFPFQQAGTHVLKVRVLDPQGAQATTLVPLQISACQQDVDCGENLRCQEDVCQPIAESAPSDAGPESPDSRPTPGCGCQSATVTTAGGLFWFLLCMVALICRLFPKNHGPKPDHTI